MAVFLRRSPLWVMARLQLLPHNGSWWFCFLTTGGLVGQGCVIAPCECDRVKLPHNCCIAWAEVWVTQMSLLLVPVCCLMPLAGCSSWAWLDHANQPQPLLAQPLNPSLLSCLT